MEFLPIKYPVTYDGPINISLERPAPMAQSGSVCINLGSSRLSLDFRYMSERIEKTTGLRNTPKNRLVAQAILNEIFWQISQKQFRFEEVFPHATRQQKERIALAEKRDYHPAPDQVLFKDYVDDWRKDYMSLLSPSMRLLAKETLDSRLLPYFKDYSFYEITRPAMRAFVMQLRNKRSGEPLTRKRIVNMMTTMRRVWFDAVDDHHWDLRDPFDGLSRCYPKHKPASRIVMRFGEFLKVRDHLPLFYQPIVDFMALTGASPGEISGLKLHHISDGYIHFQESRVDKYHNDDEIGTLKEDSRNRKMEITIAIQKCLDILLPRANSELVFVMHDGDNYNHDRFRDYFWKKAVKSAGVKYHIPYEIRHSFTAWCLTVGVDMNRLVSLMGHSSKEMVYEKYGKYVEGLEMDREKIKEFFGQDFVRSTTVIEQPLRPKSKKK